MPFDKFKGIYLLKKISNILNGSFVFIFDTFATTTITRKNSCANFILVITIQRRKLQYITIKDLLIRSAFVNFRLQRNFKVDALQNFTLSYLIIFKSK